MTTMLENLQAILPRIAPGADRVEGLQQLSGGASQEIWRFDLIQTDQGVQKRTPLVLRRAPGGDLAPGHGIGLEAEAALISAAGARGVPVPAVRLVLRPADGLGHGFIMAFVEGETLGGRIVKSPALAAARASLAHECGTILARIHAIDPAPFPMLAAASPAELVTQWRHSYRNGGTRRPVFDLALNWLDKTSPKPAPLPCVVHGDFRNGNLMIGPDGVRAVLDWELAHLGDPLEDLGWLCVNSWRFGQIDKPVGGFGPREDLWAGYEAACGRRVDRAASHWWEVFGTMRWGVICASAHAAFKGGDPTVERAMIARRTSETEIDLLRLLAD
jgi:aminoglycoside phosphotransferase (APT) family kinase protein